MWETGEDYFRYRKEKGKDKAKEGTDSCSAEVYRSEVLEALM
jgi:hypothetical protein